MTIIADSGSTKTTWMDVETGNTLVTEGLNPHFTSDKKFQATCFTVYEYFSISNYTPKLFFYSAGCGSEANNMRAKQLLTIVFKTDNVHVETDMLGACRAVSGDQSGLVGILGTGSNACYYDGKNVIKQAVSTGYILGDHGSANHVGRKLLQDYLTGNMPVHLKSLFHEAYPQTKEDFLDAIYHQLNANRFLASLAKFAVNNIENEYCSSTLSLSLIDWGKYQLFDLCEKTNCNDLYLVGGFASRIKRSFLDNFARDHNLIIKKVIDNPIEGLREYHQKHDML